jgi:hypothetical protein
MSISLITNLIINFITLHYRTYPSRSAATLMRAQDLYRCDSSAAIPILHNTVIKFNVSYVEDFCGTEMMSDSMEESSIGSKLEIQGGVISSLKVSLTPQQYSQLLDSISNIASGVSHDFHEMSLVVEQRTNWEKETSMFRKKNNAGGGPGVPLPSPTKSYEESLLIFSCFEVPELIVELVLKDTGSIPGNTPPHLSLSCSELSFRCDRKSTSTEMDICLKALKLEDTTVDGYAWNRILAMSKTETSSSSESELKKRFIPPTTVGGSFRSSSDYVSKSCPDLHHQSSTLPVLIPESFSGDVSSSGYELTSKMESTSLPEALDPSEIFRGRCFQSRSSKLSSRKRKMSISGEGNNQQQHQFCPCTPPPSPRPDENSFENLVQIKMLLVDAKSPNFVTQYGGNHKSVTVDFNTLEVLLTPETFCCLRKFFADAAKDSKAPESVSWKKVSVVEVPREYSLEEERNTETVITVKALSVKLAKRTGLLAEAEVSNVSCELKNRGSDYFGVEGRLGSLEVRDISSHSGVYPVKFAFQGSQALDFDYTRKGTDGKFRLKMSSIVCVHTHRFYTEFTTVWSEIFGQPVSTENVPASASQEGCSNESTRVILDIQAGAPVLLFPYSSTSDKLLVAELGHLSVRNKFIEESGDLVLNCISVDLIEMDLYSGELLQQSSFLESSGSKKTWRLHKDWIVSKTKGGDSSFLKKQCALSLKMRRVFDGNVSDSIAATRVQGVLSAVHCTIDPEKYKVRNRIKLSFFSIF